MTPFRHLLHDHRLWGIRRRTVVPAFSLGLFISVLPFPGHMLVSALLALFLRVNIPVAALATWANSPLTMAPVYYFSYRLGRNLLDAPLREFELALSWEWVTHTLVTIWQPMLLGSVIVASAVALVGYLTLDLIWRTSISNYKARKRNKRSDQQA